MKRKEKAAALTYVHTKFNPSLGITNLKNDVKAIPFGNTDILVSTDSTRLQSVQVGVGNPHILPKALGDAT